MDRMNLILIGVMGCGKSTIGRMLAKRLKRRFVDMDAVIEERHGKIVDLFAQIGEDGFRNLETALSIELSEQDELVISTGGGIVKRPENLQALRRNGRVLFLDRPSATILKTLKTDTRPLIRDNPEKLHQILSERYPLYLAQSDVRIDAGGSMNRTMSQILRFYRAENRLG
jgi:shikimate kinase